MRSCRTTRRVPQDGVPGGADAFVRPMGTGEGARREGRADVRRDVAGAAEDLESVCVGTSQGAQARGEPVSHRDVAARGRRAVGSHEAVGVGGRVTEDRHEKAVGRARDVWVVVLAHATVLPEGSGGAHRELGEPREFVDVLAHGRGGGSGGGRV
jgi:hypothetical protein